MVLSHDSLREILVPPGHLGEREFAIAEKESTRKDVPLERVLVEDGLLSDLHLGQAVANYFDRRFVDLHEVRIDDSFLEVIPEVVARAQHALVVGITDDTIQVATTDMQNYEFFKLLEKKTGKQVEVSYTTELNLQDGFKYYKEDYREVIEALLERNKEEQQEEDIVTLVDLFLEYAHDNRASDIHIEPLSGAILVRFRIDGLLHEIVRYPKELHDKIVFRIKILAQLKTDEHAAAQDGRFDHAKDGRVFDIRVSIIPVTDGENVVMRLLSADARRYTLDKLGLRKPDYDRIVAASELPHGMILAVGPTGSGKTTVLYTIIERLKRPEVNIMTIEDPVEYDVEGVQQTQVNSQKKLTFSTGLRSIVRQDPDIIMVGEIRDEDTADIAINAALTGHLLLSTLHTNDAATTFPRLMEMHVEPFLIASSVNLIIALRLVRQICPHCKESYLPTKSDLSLIKNYPLVEQYMREVSGKEDLETVRLYRGAKCKICNHSGFIGRIGIFELLQVDEGIRSLVIHHATAEEIDKKAKEKGMKSLLYDGVVKTIEGTTTLEEVIKAAKAS